MAPHDNMTGLRKAAVLLLRLGKANSTKVLSLLQENEVEQLSSEIVRLDSVSHEATQSVTDEFYEMATARKYVAHGGMDYARDLLVSTLGYDRADEIVHRIGALLLDVPFSFLQRADPRQVLSFLQDEHPQTIALVLAHVPSGQASQVLAGLAPEKQAEVAHRIATMEQTSPEVIRKVESLLQRRFSSLLQPSDLSTVGGVEPLVNIINRSDRATERSILEGLTKRSPELAEFIRSQMFMFEDIVGIDDRSMQLVLRQIEPNDLATALKGVSNEVNQKIVRNLSERAAENLSDEIEVLGSVRLRTVEEAQAKIIRVIRQLEESGQIVLRRSNEDDEYVD
ncbi:flagellar motor switch protein FliG [Actinosynnema pretiosum]|uniref:Flagellar motor switch protein FliG n=2 Tax=Actinosynnema TaxID=40566 RepID=A0A290Z4L6_9PSEU|nr:flagellar motor switch protein FliG [Actinosynnema pretiosum]ATE53922.1 flagellar motor switch protein FliG [Actinosynnema pretiosum]